MGAVGFGFRCCPVHKSTCPRCGGLSTDSSEGSAPHYEVFVALKGLRNLSEENRDKVHERQGQGMTACPFHSACPQVLWAQGRDEEEGCGQENLPGALGREG